MEATTVTQLITVSGALGGTVIAGFISYFIQRDARKAENEKLKKQLLFKLVEEELKDKKEIIKPFLKFINSINLPSDFDFHDDGGETLDSIIIMQQDLIKNKVSELLLEYTIYITQEIQDAIWSVNNAVNMLRQYEAHNYDLELSSEENHDLLLQNCADIPRQIWIALIHLKDLLYKEINITNKI